MTPQQIQKKLETMRGRNYDYAKAVHTVKSFDIDATAETFVITTDKNKFKRKFESAPEFFKYWYDAKENIVLDKAVAKMKKEDDWDQALPSVMEKENNLADELVEILKDNIAKVKKDPGYIKQAQSINNNVNSILHVQKLKLDMIKQSKKY